MRLLSTVAVAVLLGPLASFVAAGDVAELARQLASDDLTRRIGAAEALTKLGKDSQPAVPALVTALETAPIEVRVAAARAVQAVGPAGKDAISALVKLLSDERFWVREQAAESLAAIGDAAQPALLKVLKIAPRGVARAAAAYGLGLGTSTDDAVFRTLATALREEEPRVRATAAAALIRFGPPAVPALAGAADDTEAPVIVAIAESLQTIHARPQTAVPALARALSHPQGSAAAAKALQAFGTDAQSAVPALVRAYPAGSAERFSRGDDAVVEALAHIGPAREEEAGALRELLAHETPQVRALTATELSKLPATEETVAALRRSLSDGEALPRVAAAGALIVLQRSAPDAIDVLEKAFESEDYETLRSASEALALAGKPGVPALDRIVERGHSEASFWAQDALDKILGDTRIPPAKVEVPRLIAAFKAGDLKPRDFADRVRPFGPDAGAAKELLIPALEQGDESSRASVFAALCGMSRDDQKTTALLLQAVRDGKVNRAWALTALPDLGARGGKTAAFIAEYLKSKDSYVREQAAVALSRLEVAAKEVEALRTALKDPEFPVRFQAAFALWKATGEREPLVEAVAVAFGDRERIADDGYNAYYGRREVLSTIAEMRTEGAFLAPALIPALSLDDEEIVVGAAELLGGFGPDAKEVIPALTTLAKKTDYPLRKAALDALRKVDPQRKPEE